MFKLLVPQLYVESLYAIPLADLRKKGIRGIIIDLDNTLTSWDRDYLEDAVLRWFLDLKEQGFEVCLVSNNSQTRVVSFGRKLGVPAIPKAKKPRRGAFREAMGLLKTGPEETAVIGDQVFTDILGGNRLGLFTVLVVPLSQREFIGTRVMRIFERAVLRALTWRNMLPK